MRFRTVAYSGSILLASLNRSSSERNDATSCSLALLSSCTVSNRTVFTHLPGGLWRFESQLLGGVSSPAGALLVVGMTHFRSRDKPLAFTRHSSDDVTRLQQLADLLESRGVVGGVSSFPKLLRKYELEVGGTHAAPLAADGPQEPDRCRDGILSHTHTHTQCHTHTTPSSVHTHGVACSCHASINFAVRQTNNLVAVAFSKCTPKFQSFCLSLFFHRAPRYLYFLNVLLDYWLYSFHVLPPGRSICN